MLSLSSRSRAWSLLSMTTTLLALLYLPTKTCAEFNEENCLRCVGLGYISDNLSNSTYCAVVADDDNTDEQTYQCLSKGEVASCTDGSSSFYVGEECINEKEMAVVVTILILLCCCCGTAIASLSVFEHTSKPVHRFLDESCFAAMHGWEMFDRRFPGSSSQSKHTTIIPYSDNESNSLGAPTGVPTNGGSQYSRCHGLQ
jgi:hypothetical protein